MVTRILFRQKMDSFTFGPSLLFPGKPISPLKPGAPIGPCAPGGPSLPPSPC